MVIDNKKTVTGLHIKRRLLLLILLIALVLLIFKDSFLGIDRAIYIIVLNSLYLLYYFRGTIRDYNYIYYNDLGQKIIFKYYFLEPLKKVKKTIEIDKNTFYKFKFQKKLMGLRLYLYAISATKWRNCKISARKPGLIEEKRN